MWVPIRNHHLKGFKRDLCFYFFSVWKMAFFRSPIVYIALVCLEKVANHITFDQSTKQTHHTFFPKRETSISFVFCSLSSLGIDLPLIWVSEHYVVGSWSLWCIWNPWRSCCWTTLSCGCFACRLRRQYPPVWVLKFELPASSWQRSPIPEDPSSLACPSPLVCVTFKAAIPWTGVPWAAVYCTIWPCLLCHPFESFGNVHLPFLAVCSWPPFPFVHCQLSKGLRSLG
jgi:hypothetical protein